MNNEGSATVESSLVFPLVIFFVVMIISISIFAYENISAKLKFSNSLQETESYEDVDVTQELILENEMLFKNTWGALVEKTTEITEKVKKKISHSSIINKVNERDFELEKAGEILNIQLINYLEEELPNAQIQIYNNKGTMAKVIKSCNENNQITLPAGTYSGSVLLNNQKVSFKFIITE